MTQPDTPYLPPHVQSRYDELTEHTGITPTVTRINATTYQLDHGNDTVHLMCRYRRRSTKGRGHQAFSYTSTLTVNGQPRELVSSVEAYARLLEDPTNDRPDRRPGAELPPVYPLADGEELPAMVAKVIKTTEGSEKITSLTVGHTSRAQRQRWGAWTYPLNEDDQYPDPDGWVIETTTVDGNRVQMHFMPHPKMPGGVLFSGVSSVDSQGRDCMGEYGKNIDRAMEELLGINVPQQAEDTATGRTPRGDTRGEASNAVTVRRATVYRV